MGIFPLNLPYHPLASFKFEMLKRAFLIHGWEGYPEEGWRPWLKKELEKRGFEVFIPAMPETKRPRRKAWVSHLSQVVGTPDKDCYFVGHSLGCITILRYLETLGEGEKVGGAVLVAGFGQDLDYPGYQGEVSEFFATPSDWEKIKNRCPKFVAIHSGDDQWVSAKNLDLFKEKLGAKTHLLQGWKHFSGDDGIIEVPLVLEELLEMAS